MSGKGPEVVERGGYSGGGAPESDTTSFDNHTPAGGDTYREISNRQAQDTPEYVIGLDGPQNAGEGPFLDREKLTRGEVRETQDAKRPMIDPMVLAGAGIVLVLIFGSAGLYYASGTAPTVVKPLEEIGPASVSGSEVKQEVDGVQVRTGLQQAPQGAIGSGQQRTQLNALPTGERVTDTPSEDAATPEPAPQAP